MSSRIVDDNINVGDPSWFTSSSEEDGDSDNSLFDEPSDNRLTEDNQSDNENVSHAYLISMLCAYINSICILLHLTSSFSKMCRWTWVIKTWTLVQMNPTLRTVMMYVPILFQFCNNLKRLLIENPCDAAST